MLALVASATLGLALFASCAADSGDGDGGVATTATGATLLGPEAEATPVQQAWSDLYAKTVDDLRGSDDLFDLPAKQCLRGEHDTRLVLRKNAPMTLGGHDHRIILGLTRGSCRAAAAKIEVTWRWEYGAKLSKGRDLIRGAPALRAQFWHQAHEELAIDGDDIPNFLATLHEEEGRYPASLTRKELRRAQVWLPKRLTFAYTPKDDGSSYRLCVTHHTGAWRSYARELLPIAVGDDGDCSFTRQAPDSAAGLLVDAERLETLFDVPDGDTPRTCDDLPDTEELVKDGVLSPGNTVADCTTREYDAKFCVQHSSTDRWLALHPYLGWESGTGTCTLAGLAKRLKARDIWTRSAAR